MAQTRTITRRKLVTLSALDAVGRPAAAVLGAMQPRRASGRVERILVVELWGLGDVVLMTPLLSALREELPSAHITLLAKPFARTLLQESGLVDEVVAFDFPWTSHHQKYSPARYSPRDLGALFRELRRMRFDVSLDARRDIRSNVVTFLSGAARRIGYDFGGGAYLLTDAIPSGSQGDHKIDDWLRLAEPLLGRVPARNQPTLRVSPEERAAAAAQLARLGIDPDRPLVGVHPGASHPVRRWDAARLRHVCQAVRDEHGAQVIVFREPGSTAHAGLPAGVVEYEPDLRMLMAMTSLCSVFVCNDSGPMHIAVALDVPVTAVFGPQRSEWYGPIGPKHRVVRIDEMPCRPCFDACIHPEPYCMTRIASGDIVGAVAEQLRLSRAASVHTSPAVASQPSHKIGAVFLD